MSPLHILAEFALNLFLINLTISVTIWQFSWIDLLLLGIMSISYLNEQAQWVVMSETLQLLFFGVLLLAGTVIVWRKITIQANLEGHKDYERFQLQNQKNKVEDRTISLHDMEKINTGLSGIVIVVALSVIVLPQVSFLATIVPALALFLINLRYYTTGKRARIAINSYFNRFY